MKKQVAKRKTGSTVMDLTPPPARGTRVWLTTLKHKQGPLAALVTADGSIVACSFIKTRSAGAVAKGWQQQYKHLDFQTGKAPKAANINKAAPIGTPFQRAVWLAVSFIPSGCVAAYSDIARAIGRPRAMWAVGNAVGKNPLAPFVPCHRVIAADGGIGGYTGGLATKRALLKDEGTVL